MKKINILFLLIIISLFICISCSNEEYSSNQFKETFIKSNWECIDTIYTEGLPALTYDIYKSNISFTNNKFYFIIQSSSISIYNNDTTINNRKENIIKGNYIYNYPHLELQDTLTNTYKGEYTHTKNELTLYYMNKNYIFMSTNKPSL